MVLVTGATMTTGAGDGGSWDRQPHGWRNLLTLEDVKLWVAEHDGRINAYWEQQHAWNIVTDIKLSEVRASITALEKRVFMLAGAGGTIGAALGTLLQFVLARIGAG